MNNLKKLNDTLGIVEFSTGTYPFGGLERFLITLKAFELIPIECYDGFSIVKFKWESDFEYDAIELPEKTKVYLKNRTLRKKPVYNTRYILSWLRTLLKF